jgi:Ca2+-binding RTX toxin-like protein
MRKYLRHRALGFESLESRRVLASSAAFNAITGALTVTGDASANNLIVQALNSYVVVRDNGVDLIAPNTVPASAVKSLTVAAGDGNDTVSLAGMDTWAYSQLFTAPIVDGGSGNDHITGSNIDDKLYGVGGSDTLIGINGADYLAGGTEGDFLYGDWGSNNASFIFNDALYGEAGNDVLEADQGADYLNRSTKKG